MAVGLTLENDTWSWNDGTGAKIPAHPNLTAWDTSQPDNKSGEEYYACINIHSFKLHDFPAYLKKYIICEYGKLIDLHLHLCSELCMLCHTVSVCTPSLDSPTYD